jgi:hypothetical protein
MRSLLREKSKVAVKCEKVNRYFIEKNNSMYYSKCWDRDNLLAGKKLEAGVTRNPFLIEGKSQRFGYLAREDGRVNRVSCT